MTQGDAEVDLLKVPAVGSNVTAVLLLVEMGFAVFQDDAPGEVRPFSFALRILKRTGMP